MTPLIRSYSLNKRQGEFSLLISRKGTTLTNDFTQGSITKHIVIFAIPMLFGNLLQQLYLITDTIVVGRFIGYHALAAIGIATTAIQLLIGFAIGMTGGVSVIIAQSVGAKQEDKARKSVAMGLLISLFTSLILGVLGVILIRPLFSLMQTPDDIIDGAVIYAVIMFLGAPVTLLYNYVSAILRAYGDSRTPLISLIIASVLNIILNLIFVVLLGWGIAEVALGTLISQLVSGLICGFYALKNIPELKIKKTDFNYDGDLIKAQLKIGIPMALHASVLAVGSLLMQTVLNTLGSMTLAAYALAMRIDVFLYACLQAFGTAVSTFTAQNYGAGRLDRIKKSVYITTLITVSICLVFVVLMVFFSPQIMGIFIGTEESEVINLSVLYVRGNSLFYPLLGVMFVMIFATQGVGKPMAGMCSSVLELAVRPIAAFLLAEQFGFSGFRFANAITWSCSFVLLVVAYVIIIRKIEKSKVCDIRTR